MDEEQRYENGMKVRRAVLGDKHVDRAQANLNAFNEDFQHLITRYAWGEIWTRPGLPRHTRRIMACRVRRSVRRYCKLPSTVAYRRLTQRSLWRKKCLPTSTPSSLDACLIQCSGRATSLSLHQRH